MRVLCSCPPLEGFVHPLLPIASALVAAGHDVRVATGANMQLRIRQAGLTPLLAGPTDSEAAAATARLPGLSDLAPGEQWRFGVAMFARVLAPAKLPDLQRIVAEWRPDLVVHVSTDLAAPIAAAAAGVPAVVQGFGLQLPPPMQAALMETGAALARAHGLAPDPRAATFRSLYLEPLPESLRSPASASGPDRQPMRLDMPVSNGAQLPAWAAALGARPVVYVSMGTVPPFSQPALFRTVLEGLARHPVDVVVTVGEQNDPADLGPQPAHVHVERWLPLPLLLKRCDVVICHAGSGTVLAALAAGIPMLLQPRGADQFQNAAACARAGAARLLQPNDLNAESVARELGVLLDTAEYRQAALRLRAELDSMPPPAAVVSVLEELVESSASASPKRDKLPAR